MSAARLSMEARLHLTDIPVMQGELVERMVCGKVRAIRAAARPLLTLALRHSSVDLFLFALSPQADGSRFRRRLPSLRLPGTTRAAVLYLAIATVIRP